MTPRLLRIYQKEYEKERQEEADMIDYTAWLHGAYVFQAINAALSKNGKYPEEALSMSEEEKEEDSSVAAMRFADWANAANKAFKGKAGESK